MWAETGTGRQERVSDRSRQHGELGERAVLLERGTECWRLCIAPSGRQAGTWREEARYMDPRRPFAEVAALDEERK